MVMATTAFISLVLMISGLALKPKNTLLLLASSISWIIFAFLAYSYTFTNVAISTGLLLFGGAMAIISAVSALGVIMSKRPAKLPADYEERVHRQKVLDITRRRK